MRGKNNFVLQFTFFVLEVTKGNEYNKLTKQKQTGFAETGRDICCSVHTNKVKNGGCKMSFFNSTAWIVITFLFFTVLVAVISAWKTKGDNLESTNGYFLAGNGLPGVVIAGSLLLTNLSEIWRHNDAGADGGAI